MRLVADVHCFSVIRGKVQYGAFVPCVSTFGQPKCGVGKQE